MKSGVKLFTIIQISIIVWVSVPQKINAQEFWEEQFIVPGTYSSSPDLINDIITTDDGVFITGFFGAVDGIKANSIAFWNGTTWEALGNGLTHSDGSLAEGFELHINNNLLFVGGDFDAAGDSVVSNFAAWDISQEKWVSFPGDFNSTIKTITSSGSNIYVGGNFTQIDGSNYDHIAVWDGESWNAFQGGVNGDVNVLKRHNGQLYVGGSFSNAGGLAVSNLAIWTGTQWTDFNGGADGEVLEIHIKGDSVLVGGDFSQLNGISIPYLGILTEGLWVSFPIQPNGIIYDITNKGPEIIVAGEFIQIGVLQTNGFGIWDGNSWDVPNNELHQFSTLNSVTSYNNSWLIGGAFLSISSDIVNNIAFLGNNLEWEKFGLQEEFYGANGTIRSIEYDGNEYYAGGSFIGIGNKEISRLAKWNGENWEAVGEKPNGFIYDILVDDNLVYVVGSFTSIGGISANRIAVWNKSTKQWASLNNGANGDIYTLLKIGNSIYAAGSFTQMDGNSANRIAEWDGNSWNNLGNGTDGTIYSIIEYQGKIYAGGNFGNAGASSADNIAAWNGTIWENMDSGVDGSVFALAKTDTSIFIGGDFENTPDGMGRRIVEWVSINNSWTEVGEGLNDLVQSIVISGDSLYAGGKFRNENASGVIVIGDGKPNLNSIALWDKSGKWKSLNNGISSFSNSSSLNVYDIKVNNHTLLVGGRFDLAGEVVSSNFAIWNMQGVINPTESYDKAPEKFYLHQNYPNPFNPTTNIRFELIEPSSVKLTVFNILGKEITTMINEKLNAGTYDFTFDASGLASGIYLYRIQTNSSVLTKKMMLLK